MYVVYVLKTLFWGFGFLKNKFNYNFQVCISNMMLLNTSNEGSVSWGLG